MSEMKDLIAIFKAETEEHLTKLEKGLVELEKQPENLELVSDLNREVHTLKGAARVFGFYEIQDIAHRIEDIFEVVAGKRAAFNSFRAEKIFKGMDAIRTLLEKIVQEKKIDPEVNGVDVGKICRELEECLSGPQGVQARKKREKGHKKEKDGFEATAKEDGEADQEEKKPNEKRMDRMGEASTPHSSTPQSILSEEYIRVPLSRVDKLLYLAGEVVINKMNISVVMNRTKRLSKLCKEAQKGLSNLGDLIKKELSSQNGEVLKWLTQCDACLQKIREQTFKLYDQVSAEAFHLDPIIDELQARLKEIKMLPLATIFESFPRMVRDISFQQGKEVNLIISGEETELDKKVLEGIKTSLIHILRNSIDHGIEAPEQRVAQGKTRAGTIHISAFHRGDTVVITVEDDGRGIDLDQIKQTALKKRLISTHDLEEMTEKEILHIIFMNGYSTSPIVTDVSGRGMGLDIVKRDIENLKGQILLETQKNKGTKFTLILPLTIAIIQVLMVKVQDMLFGLPMLAITECVKVRMEDISTTGGRMALPFRDQIVPLVKLSEILGLPSMSEEGEKPQREKMVVMANSLDRQVGFMVDEIVGKDEVFIKSLGSHLGKVKNVSGAMILPTGEVVVVLDIADLIAQSAFSRPLVTGKRIPLKPKPKEKRILVVEDAFSTRELEKSILETHGYLVDTAVDGLDALDRVTTAQYDLIVSDIEMPRMDGFELCKTLKDKDEYKDIPFVMVTALQREEDKRRGIEVGASAYIVKSAFEQTNLLDTIERLVG